MWRTACVLATLTLNAYASGIFSEGGGSNEAYARNDYGLKGDFQYDALPNMDQQQAQQYDQAIEPQQMWQNERNDEDDLEAILQQIKLQRMQQPQNDDPSLDIELQAPVDDVLREAEVLADRVAAEQPPKKVEETKNEKPREAAPQQQPQIKEELAEEAAPVSEEQPLVAQKKGQNEFVSFVEPIDSKQTKDVPSLEKRRLSTPVSGGERQVKYNSNGLLLVAVGTVMCVGMVGAAIGGGIYLKRRGEVRDDGDYAPYAATGPGFKNKQGEKGDESLAYKAQLHHYQQAKQKIICGDDAPGVMESDGEDCVDDENNYSVYECPGLAPTGDIEVVNPNFAQHP